MKTLLSLFSVVLLIIPATVNAQNPSVSEILDRVNVAVSDLKEGQFTMHENFAGFGTDKDSTHRESAYVCYFKRNSDDSLIGFKTASLRDDGYQVIYDGENIFSLYDRLLEVVSKKKYPEDIKDKFNSFSGAIYLINTGNMLQYYNKNSNGQRLSLIGTEIILGKKCYKLTDRDDSKDLKSGREDSIYKERIQHKYSGRSKQSNKR